MTADERPDPGPSGYLPERAARRARKIVLREPLSVGWSAAALAAALLVAVAGLAFLRAAGRPPGAPWQPLVALDAVPAGRAAASTTPGSGLVVVRAGATVRVFDDPGTPLRWCAGSGRLEGGSGQVWTLDGRLVGGDGASLRPRPSTVFDGVVYADPGGGQPAPPPAPRGERPACP